MGWWLTPLCEVENGGDKALAGFKILVGIAVFTDGEERLVQHTGDYGEGYRRAWWGKVLLGGQWLGRDLMELIHGVAKIGLPCWDCKAKEVNGR